MKSNSPNKLYSGNSGNFFIIIFVQVFSLSLSLDFMFAFALNRLFGLKSMKLKRTIQMWE